METLAYGSALSANRRPAFANPTPLLSNRSVRIAHALGKAVTKSQTKNPRECLRTNQTPFFHIGGGNMAHGLGDEVGLIRCIQSARVFSF
jgi:hypothetical protein